MLVLFIFKFPPLYPKYFGIYIYIQMASNSIMLGTVLTGTLEGNEPPELLCLITSRQKLPSKHKQQNALRKKAKTNQEVNFSTSCLLH